MQTDDFFFHKKLCLLQFLLEICICVLLLELLSRFLECLFLPTPMDPLQMALEQVMLLFGRCNHLPLLGRVAFEYDYL